MPDHTVDQPAAEREPDNVTPECRDDWHESRQQPTRPCPTCGDVADYAADQLLDREREAAALAEPERRTVSLEVLTDELRAAGNAVFAARDAEFDDEPWVLPADAVVAVVIRTAGTGALVEIFDTDATWRQLPGHDDSMVVLRDLLQVVVGLHGGGLEGIPASELLMPTPDVLAALDGRPDATFWSAPVPVMHRDMQSGWLLITYADEGDSVPAGTERQEPIEAITECTPEAADGIHPAAHSEECRVLTVDGTPCHFDTWLTNLVRIPCGVPA